ncbi:hypothetical protein ACOMICROBIO_GDFFDHBD_01743 [Vibrio sp. B1REV9]|nr:hypothetical protein ACOMICROBIO_GDFFDHBD_01743 [Vibrio sp. B1REV9]
MMNIPYFLKPTNKDSTRVDVVYVYQEGILR